MKVNGQHQRTIWPAASGRAVQVIDQRWLPHQLQIATLGDLAAVVTAIRDMWVRGAPLIGVSAAYGLALQMQHDACDSALAAAAETLQAARPTAVNLAWAVRRLQTLAGPAAGRARRRRLASGRRDGRRGRGSQRGHRPAGFAAAAGRGPRRGGRVDVLTHCNAGWLATVDWGTALSPIYQAQAAGLDVHVWVDETRPRNQGASLTAWELGQQGVAHTVIADNAGGHLMQQGQVDLVIVGCDRVSARGDVCNKIGTYLKALAARDTGVPFYAAMPLSTLDLTLLDGLLRSRSKQRSAREVSHLTGRDAEGRLVEVQLLPDGSAAANPAFDVTPARLVTGLITERGVVPTEERALRAIAA
jgi:methylthioribose-1-phosphate isomerase